MLEIYNEQVRDLLSKKASQKGGLKVRQHPAKGFYGENLIFTRIHDSFLKEIFTCYSEVIKSKCICFWFCNFICEGQICVDSYH